MVGPDRRELEQEYLVHVGTWFESPHSHSDQTQCEPW